MSVAPRLLCPVQAGRGRVRVQLRDRWLGAARREGDAPPVGIEARDAFLRGGKGRAAGVAAGQICV